LPSPVEKYCPGKKRIFEGGKEISQGKFFSTFLSLGSLLSKKVDCCAKNLTCVGKSLGF
jgi:hypothetical protein